MRLSVSTSNLNQAELNALENLTNNKKLVIQKAGKGNTVVIINKNDYKTKIKNILYDFNKFEKPLYQKEFLTKKDMIPFTQREQDQEYFTAVLRYINVSLTYR